MLVLHAFYITTHIVHALMVFQVQLIILETAQYMLM
jgi:hypothetical protein